MITRFSSVLTLTLLAATLSACAPEEKKSAASANAGSASDPVAGAPLKIRFATDASYAPFEYKTPQGDIVGFDIEIGKAICAEIKADCTFQDQAWTGIIPGLEAKKYDAILSSMSITAERKAKVNFSQKIWNVPNTMVAPEGVKVALTAEGTKDRVIGVQKGTIQDIYGTKIFTGATFKRYESLEEAYADLAAKRTEMVFADRVVVNDFLKSPKGKGYAVAGEVLSSVDPAILGEGTGIAVRKEDQVLLDALNKGITAIRANGQYKTIADKYFDFDIYGG
jgi:histidine transport system substrate-binding protein